MGFTKIWYTYGYWMVAQKGDRKRQRKETDKQKKLGNHTNKYTDKMTGKRKIVCNMKQKKIFDVRKRHSM